VDRTADEGALRHAARVLARGGELDAKLDALVEEARSAAGAISAAIYVLDPLAMTLVPAAVAGTDTRAGAETAIALDGEDPAAHAVRERRVTTAQRTVALPLVFADESGAEEAEGALVATFATDAEPVPDGALAAIADLCAVTIRGARLEHALVERAEWMDRVASADSLTGLPNRTTFERALELELARSVRQQSELSVLLFDVDGLTRINEESGADVGDDLLRRAAALLAEQVRMVDTVARVGPDEFALLAPGGGGAVVARRVQDAVTQLPAPAGVPLSMSVAVVVYPHDGATGAELLAAADATLAQAKQTGPGAVVATREP
jgi:diguanylate cyclase (GGDEF)-like protein